MRAEGYASRGEGWCLQGKGLKRETGCYTGICCLCGKQDVCSSGQEQGIKKPERDHLVLGSTLVSCCIFPPSLCSSFPQAKWGALRRLVRGLESESCTACGAAAISIQV